MSQAAIADRLPGVPPQPRCRRWRIWAGVLVLFVLVWLAIIIGFFVYSTDRDLRAAMAVADRDSPRGWLLEDIEAQREQIPDEENAALVVARVKSFLPANWPAPLEKSEHEDEPGSHQQHRHQEQPAIALPPDGALGPFGSLAPPLLAQLLDNSHA